MIIGDRLREIRKHKELSQRDIEKRTGLIRSYVSRVENGHAVPSVKTLEKFARALEVPMYQLFYESEGPPELPKLKHRSSISIWGSKGKEAHLLMQFCRLFARMADTDRKLLLYAAQKMAKRP